MTFSSVIETYIIPGTLVWSYSTTYHPSSSITKRVSRLS
nr:MAG TPA: hypothetical protein [Caudoviricetes sp.]